MLVPVMSNDVKVVVRLIFVRVVATNLVVQNLVHLLDILGVPFRRPLEDGAGASVPCQDVKDQLGLCQNKKYAIG